MRRVHHSDLSLLECIMDRPFLIEPMLRVLRLLGESTIPLSRVEIARKIRRDSTYVGRCIGFSDLEKRTKLENSAIIGAKEGKPVKTLLSLGYVTEERLPIGDNTSLMCVEITDKGRDALKAHAHIVLSEIDLDAELVPPTNEPIPLEWDDV